jgi:hypothetical protein
MQEEKAQITEKDVQEFEKSLKIIFDDEQNSFENGEKEILLSAWNGEDLEFDDKVFEKSFITVLAAVILGSKGKKVLWTTNSLWRTMIAERAAKPFQTKFKDANVIEYKHPTFALPGYRMKYDSERKEKMVQRYNLFINL